MKQSIKGLIVTIAILLSSHHCLLSTIVHNDIRHLAAFDPAYKDLEQANIKINGVEIKADSQIIFVSRPKTLQIEVVLPAQTIVNLLQSQYPKLQFIHWLSQFFTCHLFTDYSLEQNYNNTIYVTDIIVAKKTEWQHNVSCKIRPYGLRSIAITVADISEEISTENKELVR